MNEKWNESVYPNSAGASAEFRSVHGVKGQHDGAIEPSLAVRSTDGQVISANRQLRGSPHDKAVAQAKHRHDELQGPGVILEKGWRHERSVELRVFSGGG